MQIYRHLAIGESLDKVLPKVRSSMLNILQDITQLFCTLLNILRKNVKNFAKENGIVQKNSIA